MPMRLIRPVLVLAALSLGGCVAAPVPVVLAPGEVLLGQQCAAGFYVCPVAPGPVGTPCSCPGLGAPSYGTIR